MELWQQRCDTSLGLGTDLALLTSVQDGNGDQNSCFQRDEGKSKVNLHVHLPTVQLNLMLHSTAPESPSTPQLSRQHSSPKNERAIDVNKVPSAADGDEGGPAGKKLRLSKEQSSLLEHSFKEHPTLNPKQKLALAKRLDLSHRQVEVWFQNRRARTKLKQTEVDCEFLKRCCDSLKEENRRLKKELQELRALKMPASPYYMGMPPATLTMCPSCESQREVERLRHHHNNKDSL